MKEIAQAVFRSPLNELREKAQRKRFELHPEPHVTFVLDTNPNYTNICDLKCSFCAFWKKETDPAAYHKSVDEVMHHFEIAQREKLTTVLLQGGCHPKVTLPYLIEIATEAKKRYPTIHPHLFSAVEIWYAAQNSKVSVDEALQALYQVGLRTIPGGGAEILVDSVRKKLAPKKMSATEWLLFHEKAHRIGFKTTATMMFGHIETDEDIVAHLLAVRDIQERTGGFTSFIPWSFKPWNTALHKKITSVAPKEIYFRILATARLILDNVPHIAASWFGEGKEAGVEALSYGANDFGGILFEENVHKACGYALCSNKEEVCALIRKAGFIPVERNASYQQLKIYHEES